MSRILTFPSTTEHRERLAKIKSEKEMAILDAEVAEVHTKVDKEIANKYGSMEAYGRYIINKVLPRAAFDTTWVTI